MAKNKGKNKVAKKAVNTGIPGYKRFEKILRMTQEELKSYLHSYLIGCGYKVVNEDGYLFAKGDVDILLVAHMDTVHKLTPAIIVTKNGVVSSPQGIGGDDRCGIYMITEIIKETKCSVLFCEDEEIGCVGAEKFVKGNHLTEIKDMRYMIELDRRGSTDLVFYDCDNPDFEEYLLDNMEGYGTKWGTMSDISTLMENSGVAGVNVSSGYHDEHTTSETINLKEMENTLKNVKELVKKESDHFEYIEAEYLYKNYYGDYYGYGYGNGNYYGNKYKTKNQQEVGLYVVFLCDGVEDEAYVTGRTFEDAFFEFFSLYPQVCMNDVLDYYIDQIAYKTNEEKILNILKGEM